MGREEKGEGLRVSVLLFTFCGISGRFCRLEVGR